MRGSRFDRVHIAEARSCDVAVSQHHPVDSIDLNKVASNAKRRGPRFDMVWMLDRGLKACPVQNDMGIWRVLFHPFSKRFHGRLPKRQTLVREAFDAATPFEAGAHDLRGYELRAFEYETVACVDDVEAVVNEVDVENGRISLAYPIERDA